MKNDITVSANGIAFTVAKKQLPFGNNFLQQSAKVVKYQGKDEVLAFVTCTEDSMEPGRIYACAYSLKGKLMGCNTVN
jgi:hypothetical protein